MKISALTSCCVDFFPERDLAYIGGNSLNFATQCRILGQDDVSVIGGIGKDHFGKHIRKHFEQLGIDHSRLYEIDAPTASNSIYLDENGDRYFKSDSWKGGAFDTFRLKEADWDALKQSQIVAMPGGDPNLGALLKRRGKEQLIAIDFLDYLGIDFIERHIDKIDIVFLSADESQLEALQTLATKSQTLIVPTLGAKGSVAFFGNERYDQKALEVATVIDTTGCGDAFQAAFTLSWWQSKDPKTALQAGAAAAQKVLAFLGGVEQQAITIRP